MGGALSNFFQDGRALLSSGHNRGVSDQTRKNIRIVFDALRANPRVTTQRLDGLLSQVPRSENILVIHNEEGYNLLQKCVGINNLEMVRWCISRNIDINRGCCSLPLHIACLRGYEDLVELLLKHGARIDVEARMCWPGPHQQNCEERGKHIEGSQGEIDHYSRSSDKLQCAIYYAIDGDQVDILELLAQQGEDHWLPWQQKRPLLHIACERGAWNCVKYLVSERSDEINQCYDENFPIHQCTLHDIKFLELLIQCGATTTVRTSTQLMTALHVLLLQGKKSAEDTLQTAKLLMDHGLRDLINEPDSLGNTPLHALIVRYALEERRYGYHDDPQPWNKWDMLHIARYLLQNGARPSINQARNSALACVLRHVTDWEFRYDLLNMLLTEGGDPNVEGRDGSVPLMVCLVPLINKDPLHHFSHHMKVLMHTGTENISMARVEEKTEAFEFIRNLLTLLLQHGLDPNVRFSQRSHHILLSLMDMVQNSRCPKDLNFVYSLTLTLLQYGANPNMVAGTGGSGRSRGQTAYEQSRSAGERRRGRQENVFIRRQTNNQDQVLFHYAQTLVNKDQLMADPEQSFARLIHLYYMSMKHMEVYNCLKVLSAQLSISSTKACQTLYSVIKDLNRPRTLKQMCRVVVYNAVNQRPATTVAKLPLPPSLKDYLLNFEP